MRIVAGLAVLLAVVSVAAGADEPLKTRLIPVADGWAKSSINTVIFRHNSLVTAGETQYTAFYDNDSRVVLAKRKLGTEKWDIKTTTLTGNTKDAHNTISLGIDGAGIVHISWDHHGANLNYVRTTAPDSLELTEKLKTDGLRENAVTYPEFYTLPDGDLVLMYRVGSSGSGDLVLKRYQTATKTWTTVQQNLVTGEGRQNAYPEFCVDARGAMHLGWVWRRSPDVATNHDICYSRSTDGGKTWTDSTGKVLAMPITAASAEVAVKIPERSELINQTTIAADSLGRPYIATYFRTEGQTVPQFQIVYNDGKAWHTSQVGARKTSFTLAGGGTKRIPISRPLVLVDSPADNVKPGTPPRIFVVYRDIERQERVTLASTTDMAKGQWTLTDLTTDAFGSWEPSHDPTLWAKDRTLALFLQKTDQLDGADNATRTDNVPPTKVFVLEVKP